MKICDRYASAVHSSNLKSRETTIYSDSDVLGAAGLAAKAELHSGLRGAPLAIALARLFGGDNSAAREIVDLMADAVWAKAFSQNIKLRRVEAGDMARAILAWQRDGVCRPCGGHGFELIPGTPHFSGRDCGACNGTRKRLLTKEFKNFGIERLDLVHWLLAELQRETSKAGPAMMAALAPRLDL